MKIFLTGGNGQVGQALQRAAGNHHTVIAPPKTLLDLSILNTIPQAITTAAPDVVIHCAAYTAVDKAEQEPALAHRINSEATASIANCCQQLGIPLLYVSTDYVFDGNNTTPYTENDKPAPQSVYGASKLAGEIAITASNAQAIILRTAWVFSDWGSNFVKRMLELAETRPHLNIVADQHGAPTSAKSIAQALLTIAERVTSDTTFHQWGTYHFSGAPATTWYDFACAIFKASRYYGAAQPQLTAITTANYPTAARRPAWSVLDCTKIQQIFGINQPDWQDDLQDVFNNLMPKKPQYMAV